MGTAIPALTSVTDILDNDLVMITHSNGESFKIAGSEINKRNQAVIASTTTMTGAPLKTGNIVRVYFTADITGSNTTTGLVINYNNVNYSVKVPKNGTLANFIASDLGGSPAVYKYLQANTMLELLYDGTQFIIIGNPVVLSSADYTIYADGYNIKGNMSVIGNNVGQNKYMTKLTNESLNNITTEGWYYTEGIDSVTDKPFTALYNNVINIIKQGNTGRFTQFLFNINNQEYFSRTFSSTWSSWKLCYTSLKSTNDIQNDAKNVQYDGEYIYSGTGANYTGTVPNDNYKYGMFKVFRRNSTSIMVLAISSIGLASCYYGGSTWSAWKVYNYS